jgi:hypothetical protein
MRLEEGVGDVGQRPKKKKNVSGLMFCRIERGGSIGASWAVRPITCICLFILAATFRIFLIRSVEERCDGRVTEKQKTK